jgi:hypothetical protein
MTTSFLLETPRPLVSDVLGVLACPFLHARELYCVDGANVFDPYAFARQGRLHGVAGDTILDRVFVTRAFTVHQLRSVIRDMLPPLVPSGPGCVAPVLAVLGLDHLFREESLRVSERRRILGEVMGLLAGLRDRGLRQLVTHERTPADEPWWRPLLVYGDAGGVVVPREGGGSVPEFKIVRMRHGKNGSDLQHLLAG